MFLSEDWPVVRCEITALCFSFSSGSGTDVLAAASWDIGYEIASIGLQSKLILNIRLCVGRWVG